MIRARRDPVTIGIVDQGTEKVQHYVRCVEVAGGAAEIIDWRMPRDVAADVHRFDGLVLCGGDDIHARHFGEENHPLAICRGVQILNVALGGGLVQHVPDMAGHAEHAGGVLHALRLEPGSRLAGLAGGASRRPRVNSFHHQAAGRAAPGLRVTAWSDDGAVEGLEGPGPFCVGVQWHPEREGNDVPLGPALFASVVSAARG